MAFLTLNRESLKHNYNFLEKLFKERNISWGIVTKLLCGNKKYIQEILNLGMKEIHDSRISNLKVVKSLDPSVQTVYIKPPAKRSIPSIVKYADVSFNSEFDTISMLSKEAGKQGKKHKVVIMIEMGDLREGVLGEDLMDFYAQIIKLPNIEISGIGTNLNCLNGVMPTQDKLIQLSLYKQLIEAKFNIKIPWVSGGTSVVLPLLLKNMRPMAVNHFRLGEALFFGNDLFTNENIPEMKHDVFKLYAEIIELNEKPTVPTGYLSTNVDGKSFEIEDQDFGATSYRAIVDIGLLDIQTEYLVPEDPDLEIIEASSDMLVLDLGATNRDLKVGDLVKFNLKYMGALRLLNSNYISKEVI
ncbi:MAG: alanine racemase [Candidatus Cyclobacteriaceae bacterium M2_1C_046]